jgi:hypothetical protein
MATERTLLSWDYKIHSRIKRDDLVGKVVRLKSNQKFGIITEVHYSDDIFYNYQQDKVTVKWIIGYPKPKTSIVLLDSVYDCESFIKDMKKETDDYQANIDGVNKYYDQP